MSTTWSSPEKYVAKAVFSTASEAAPTLVTEGIALADLEAIAVHFEAGGALGAITVPAYVWNEISTQWNKAPGLDITLDGTTGGEAAGVAVLSPKGRVSWVPGVACTMTLIGTRRRP